MPGELCSHFPRLGKIVQPDDGDTNRRNYLSLPRSLPLPPLIQSYPKISCTLLGLLLNTRMVRRRHMFVFFFRWNKLDLQESETDRSTVVSRDGTSFPGRHSSDTLRTFNYVNVYFEIS